MSEPDDAAEEEDLKEYAEKVVEEFFEKDEPEISPESIAKAVGEAIKVKSHVGKDEKDQCGYCGQHFPPDENVIEKEIYGRTWAFCSDECYEDFMEKSDYKADDLDSDDITVNVKKGQ